jgi:hypothetical protein
MALAAHPRAHQAVWVAGFAAVGGAAALAARGVWPAAAVAAAAGAALLWTGGAWPAPRGADAYLRRVAAAMHHANVEADVAESAYRRGRLAAAERLERLAAPSGMEAYGARVRALARARIDPEAPDADRAAAAAAMLGERDALRGDLTGRGTTEAERRYAVAVGDLLSGGALAYEHVLERVEEATARAAQQLAGIRPPRRAAGAHAALPAAFASYADAQRSAHLAIRTGDAAGARAATERASAAYAALRDAYDAVVAALGDDLRWPPAE